MSDAVSAQRVTRPQEPDRRRSAAARVSITVAGALMLLKLVVAFWTGSLAIVASCLDSLLDLLASGVNWFVLRTAETPPDKEHPYGHGKAEYLGNLLQGVGIGLSGLFVLGEAVRRMWTPVQVRHTGAGIAVMMVGVGASAWVVMRLRRAARETDSPALYADSIHYLTDIYTNGGALVALAIVAWTRNPLLDTVAGFLIAGLVLWSAFTVLTQAVNGLMDHQLPDATVEWIRRTILDHPSVCGIHDLRARRAGADKFVQVHVEMDGRMSFEAAHTVAEDLTATIERKLHPASVTVHADPVEVDERGVVVARADSEPPAVVPPV